MENLTGTWEGEYSINIGTDEDPNVEFHTFRLKLNDQNGEISGTTYDLTLSDEPSTISGFRDNDVISFIKKYNRLVITEDGEYYGNDMEQHPDIHYLGTFNLKENCYQGTWEIHENEERERFQDEFEDQYSTGNWYMRRTN